MTAMLDTTQLRLLNTDRLKEIIEREREQGRAFGPVAEECRVILMLRSGKNA